jgi:hypothetical protein
VSGEERGYPSPEEAALAGFDSRFARIVRVRSQDVDHVEVELATNEPPREYPYFVHVERIGELWHEATSHN